MRSISIFISMIFFYGTLLAQGTSYVAPTPTTNDPDARTEVKKEQRLELGDLKGPQAKNYPKYKYVASEVTVEAPSADTERRIGPEAKNYRPWQDDQPTQHVTITQKDRKNLKGPLAKNQKPWDT